MAPPRSGSNKKAQLGVFTGYVLAGGGALFGAALLTISLLRPETFHGLQDARGEPPRGARVFLEEEGVCSLEVQVGEPSPDVAGSVSPSPVVPSVGFSGPVTKAARV